MDIMKLLLIFSTIVMVLKLKKPLWFAILAAICMTEFLFQLDIKIFLSIILESSIKQETISILLVFYLITFLQRMLEKRGSLALAQEALDRLFNSRRATVALAPFFLGLVPSASIVTLCGDIVHKSTGDALTKEEKAFVTSFYRHIPEAFLPTFSTIILSINLSNGHITIGSFMLAMMPMIIILIGLGYIFYLKKIPNEVLITSVNDTIWDNLIDFLKGTWTIIFILMLILIWDISVHIAALYAIAFFVMIGRFKILELKPFALAAFEKNLLVSTFTIMIFKDVLSATGVINSLPHILGTLPLPSFLIFSLIFFFGTIIGGSQAIVILGVPLVFSAIPEAGLPLFILLMSLSFIANQITPTHVCLAVITEYFEVSFNSFIKKSIPIILYFIMIVFCYYFFLTKLIT